MAVEFFDFEEIKKSASCTKVAELLGLSLSPDGRCAATWRGGTNPTSVSINESGFYDHAIEQGGSSIDLVAVVKFNGIPMMAQQWLGQALGLTPKGYGKPCPQTGPTRYESLLENGYHEAARYNYTDANGKLIHQAVRLEHPEKSKEFLQCDAAGRWGVKHVNLVLYNLPNITAADWAVVVEGEKDADTLIGWDLPATTNVGGAKKWNDTYTKTLTGKHVILMPDNDEAGRHHLNLIGKSLKGKAASIRVLTVSKRPKGDVTDWVEFEGGTVEQLNKWIAAAPSWIEPRDDEMALATAKELNRKPLLNYKIEKVPMQDGSQKIVKKERHPCDIITDIHKRLLGFPRLIGGTLFDHDRDTGRINYLDKSPILFAWMRLKISGGLDWARGDKLTSREELFSALRLQGKRYESISKVPDWPTRDDTYYVHPELPMPTPGHAAFNGLIDFFAPAGPEYKTLLKALFCAPLFYRHGIARPMWVIDSEDGAGTGKTTIAETVAELYMSSPMQVRPGDFARGMEAIVGRLVSSTGRQCRVFLLDNVTGNFHSECLSGMITQSSISGKPPYGRGEESRPNNLTYIITANSASLDNDLTIRSFFVFVKRTKYSTIWKTNLIEYVAANRLKIFSDMIDILSVDSEIQPQTRFPDFEKAILYPHCANDSEYENIIELLCTVSSASNSDVELAARVRAEIESHLDRVGARGQSVFLESALVGKWTATLFQGKSNGVQIIRNLAKNGMLPEVNASVKKLRFGEFRPSGITWRGTNPDDPPLFALSGDASNPTKII